DALLRPFLDHQAVTLNALGLLGDMRIIKTASGVSGSGDRRDQGQFGIALHGSSGWRQTGPSGRKDGRAGPRPRPSIILSGTVLAAWTSRSWRWTAPEHPVAALSAVTGVARFPWPDPRQPGCRYRLPGC